MPVKVYNGTDWVTVAGDGQAGAPGAAGTSSSIATWVKTASGGETSVSGTGDTGYGTLAYTVGQELVYLNGVLLDRGDDYTATTGTSITGLTALLANDVVTVWTVNSFSVANTYTIAQADAAFAPISTGMTVLASGSLSGSIVTLSSISGAYKNLQLVMRDFYPSTTTSTSIRLNGNTSTVYQGNGTYYGLTGPISGVVTLSDTVMEVTQTASAAADNNNCIVLNIFDYAGTSSNKACQSISSTVSATYGAFTNNLGWSFKSTTAITSLSMFPNSGTFSGGTYILYGVN